MMMVCEYFCDTSTKRPLHHRHKQFVGGLSHRLFHTRSIFFPLPLPTKSKGQVFMNCRSGMRSNLDCFREERESDHLCFSAATDAVSMATLCSRSRIPRKMVCSPAPTPMLMHTGVSHTHWRR